jgi:hypothetical protein
MTALSFSILAVGALVAIDIQMRTLVIIDEQQAVRVEIMSSRTRCPEPQQRGICQWQIAARSHNSWVPCDAAHPPSGADLPMHRWFRVTGNCSLIGPVTPAETSRWITPSWIGSLKISTLPMEIFR